MIVAVTNRGSISYIVKSDRYDRKEALKLYYDSAEKYKGADDLRQKQNVTGEFLHNCYKVGLIYEEH